MLLIRCNMLTVSLTGSTCGDACWHAREDVCRCSCGGRNHGCLLQNGAEQPRRMAKIDGQPCTLLAVGLNDASTAFTLDAQAQEIHRAAGIMFANAHTARQHYGYSPLVYLRPATAAQIARWPELAAWKDAPTGYFAPRPMLLWRAEA